MGGDDVQHPDPDGGGQEPAAAGGTPGAPPFWLAVLGSLAFVGVGVWMLLDPAAWSVRVGRFVPAWSLRVIGVVCIVLFGGAFVRAFTLLRPNRRRD